jgi:hypothetical protein
MIVGRREVISSAVLAGALVATPASAYRSPGAKDRKGYKAATEALFTAWWARDYEAYERTFHHSLVSKAFRGRALFKAHYEKPERRFLGQLLFNGASLVAQVIRPRPPDPPRGICGGHAASDLFLIQFYPGIEVPVIRKVQYLDTDLLAAEEWNRLSGSR